MPQINGVELPWDVYNYVQNTGDTSKVAQYAQPQAAPAPQQQAAQQQAAPAPGPAYNPQDYLPFDQWVATQPAANQAYLAQQGPQFAEQFGYRGHLSPTAQWGSAGAGTGAGAGAGGPSIGAGGQVQLGGAAGGSNDAYTNLLMQQAAANAANQAAEMAYRNALLMGYADDRALAAAQQAWTQAYKEKEFEYQQQQDAKQFGLTEAGVTGMYQGAPTLARQTAENSTALSLLGMNAQLSGPSNYLSYLRTLSNTPSGLTDLVNGMAGRFQMAPGQGSVPGASYERQSVDTMIRDLNQARAGGVPGMHDASGVALPAGNQWNAANMQQILSNPTQAGLARNLYQESGRDWDTEYSQFLGSLPRFSGAQGAQLQMGR